MDAPQCKAKFFDVLDELAARRKGMAVTGNGKPIAEIRPLEGSAKRQPSKKRLRVKVAPKEWSVSTASGCNVVPWK